MQLNKKLIILNNENAELVKNFEQEKTKLIESFKNSTLEELNTFIQQTDTAWKPIENEAEETMAISGVYYDNLKRGLNF